MSTLKQKTVSALLWDFLGTFSTHGVGFVISIILARLLTPAEFGIVGMAMVVLAFSKSLLGAGFPSALIQSKHNESVTYSSVFYINILMGLFLFGLFQLLAQPIAVFYEEPIIESLVRLLALQFIFGSLNLVQTAILKRQLRFKSLSIRLFLAGVLSGIVGIGLALRGWGVYALVVQSLSASLVTTIILWRVGKWQPRWEFSKSEIKRLFQFSGYVFSIQFIYQSVQKGYIFMIGSLFSPATLGFYTRANSLRRLVTTYSSGSILKVFLPTFSRVQDDRPRFDALFLRSMRATALLCFLLTGLLFFSAEWIILTLFGPQWETSVLLFQILIFTLYSVPLNALMVNAFLALGKVKQNFWLGIVRCLLLAPPVLAAFWSGLDAFLWTLVVVNLVGTVFNCLMLSRYCHIAMTTQLKAIIPYLIYCVAPVLMLHYFLPEVSSLFLSTLLDSTLYVFCYLLFVLLFNNQVIVDLYQLLTPTIQNKMTKLTHFFKANKLFGNEI